MQSRSKAAPTAESTGTEAPDIDADDAIREVVVRLSRPHRSGGAVIERAAILAEGRSSAAVLEWIAAHDGEPEAVPVAEKSRGGLFGGRDGVVTRQPLRYVLPPGALSR
jgi:hypothetical protein